jgi:hypothetical protein
MASVDDEQYHQKDMSIMAAMAVYGLGPDEMYEAASSIDAPEPVESSSIGSADGSGLRCVITRY